MASLSAEIAPDARSECAALVLKCAGGVNDNAGILSALVCVAATASTLSWDMSCARALASAGDSTGVWSGASGRNLGIGAL